MHLKIIRLLNSSLSPLRFHRDKNLSPSCIMVIVLFSKIPESREGSSLALHLDILLEARLLDD